MGGCLEGPRPRPPRLLAQAKASTGIPRPHAQVLADTVRGGAGGGNNGPLEMCTPLATRRCTWVPVNVCPTQPYLNISVTSPLASATRTGKPIQAGTRYRRAGCEERGWSGSAARTPAQGHAQHPDPLLGLTVGQLVLAQVGRANQWLDRNPGLLDSQTRAAPPWAANTKKLKDTGLQGVPGVWLAV